MRSRIARHASLILVGAMLLLFVPTTSALAGGLDSITSVTPGMLPPGATATITLHGSFLFSPSSFAFSPSTGITINSASANGGNWDLNITIAPNAPTGLRDVSETDITGTSTCAHCFLVTPPPVISGDSPISPTSLAAGAGPITYTITGTGFRSGAVVQIAGNGVTAGATTVAGDGTSLTVPLSAASNAVPGPRDVTVTNDDGQSSTCPGCLLLAGPPTAGTFFPAQRAPGLTNQEIDIVGSGFDPTTTVSFSGGKISVQTTTFVNSAYLKVFINVDPNAPLGAVDVTFDNSDNGGHSVCTACFAVTGPTSIAIQTPSTVTGPIVATFSQPVSGVSSSNSFVRFTGHTYNLVTTLTCRDKDGFLTDCASGYVKTVTLQPTSRITPGQYYTVHIAAASSPAVIDFGGLTVAEQTQDFRGGLVQPGESPPTNLVWRTVKTTAAYGGSYVIDHLAGASAAYRFTGSAIVWYTNIGPSYGIADLYVDGVRRAVVNSYSATTHYRAAFTVSGLPYGAHTLTIRVRGAKGSSHGTGTNIAIDAFTVGRTLNVTPGLASAWATVTASSALGGLYSWSDLAGSTASLVFRGTQVEWDTVTGPQMGIARVYIDNVLKATIDNYSAATAYNVKKMFSGLSDAVHTLTIIVQGTHRTASHGSFVAVDGWVVT